MNKLPLLMIAGVLTGCSLAPEFKRPEPPVPLQFPGISAAPEYAVLPDSRLVFRDPRLQRLIELGLAANRDMRVATLNIDQARAQYRIQRADLGVWGVTEQKVHLSPAPSRNPLRRLVVRE
ncbi:MAG: hypothetical protein K2Y25_11245 [Pseudomonadaceae bacterium]|nr:hypothetical protein [Pseudomonadaceae bacterium]